MTCSIYLLFPQKVDKPQQPDSKGPTILRRNVAMPPPADAASNGIINQVPTQVMVILDINLPFLKCIRTIYIPHSSYKTNVASFTTHSNSLNLKKIR